MRFLCLSRPSTRIHRVPQRDNDRSPQSSGYPWSSFPKKSAPTIEPPRQGQLPLLLCTWVCKKIPMIHFPAPHKNPLCLGSVSTRIVWCTQTSPGFCTIAFSTRFHPRLHSLCVNLRQCHCWSLGPRRRCSPWARYLLHQSEANRTPTEVFTRGEIGNHCRLLGSEVAPLHHRKPYSCSGWFKPNAVPRKCWCNCNFRMYSLVFRIYCNPMFIPRCYYVMSCPDVPIGKIYNVNKSCQVIVGNPPIV